MEELVFLLILAGIGVVLLVAMFTYYTHHKKINDEIKAFNHHSYSIDDVLLDESKQSTDNNIPADKLLDDDFPDSFSASRQDHFDIDDVRIKHDTYAHNSPTPSPLSVAEDSLPDERLAENSLASDALEDADSSLPVEKAVADGRELVDGVFINSKRVISKSSPSYSAAVQKKGKPVMNCQLQPDSSSRTSTNQSAQQASQAASIQSNKNQTDSQIIKVVYDPLPEGIEELIISHTILAKSEPFSGKALFNALGSAGLLFGEMNIFHYPGDKKADTYALFSIANIVEPGTFDPQTSESLSTPGITLFMRLPTRRDNYAAYDEFIRVAQKIATELNGELCDETRSQLTQQVIAYKKEQIKKLNFALVKAEKIAGSTR